MKTFVLAAFVVSIFGQQSNSKISQSPKAIHDPLLEAASVPITSSNTLSVEPGVRAWVSENSFSLATYDYSQIEIQSAMGSFLVLSPATGNMTSKGIEINGVTHPAIFSFLARRVVQDDTDTNLKSMQESAKKLKAKNDANQDASKQPTKKLKHRWLFGENPNPTAELFNQAAIQQLTHLSPIGF